MALMVKLAAAGAVLWAIVAGLTGAIRPAAAQAPRQVVVEYRTPPTSQQASAAAPAAQPMPRTQAVVVTPAQQDVTQQVVMHAFAPVVALVQAVAYPVCYLMMAAGALLLATGAKQKGIAAMKWAAIGYIVLQFTPAMMQILVQVGDAMRSSGG